MSVNKHILTGVHQHDVFEISAMSASVGALTSRSPGGISGSRRQTISDSTSAVLTGSG